MRAWTGKETTASDTNIQMGKRKICVPEDQRERNGDIYDSGELFLSLLFLPVLLSLQFIKFPGKEQPIRWPCIVP